MTPLTPQDYLEIAYRHRWWIIVPIVLSLFAAASLVHVLPKWYRSSTLILVEPQKVPPEYVRVAVTGSTEDRLSTIQQQLLSRSLLQQIVDEFKPYPAKDSQITNEEITTSLRKRITIKTIRSRNISSFTISFVGRDPMTTMNITNKLASLFIEENLKIREQLVEGTANFLDTELQHLREKLENQEQNMSQYKQRYMGILPSQMNANLRTLDRYQLQLQSVTASLHVVEDRKILREQMQALGSNALIPTASGGLQVDPRIGQLQTLKRRLSKLEAEYTESYPDIVIAKQEIAQLEADRLSDNTPSSSSDMPVVQSAASTIGQQLTAIEQETARLKEQQQIILDQIAHYEKRVEETPKRELELTSLTRDYENMRKSYDILLSKAGNAKISENLEKRQKGERFRILDPANFPEKPFKPDLNKFLLLGLAIGAGLGAAIVFTLENLDTSIKKSDELEEQFGVPVLGVIPQSNVLCKVGVHDGSSTFSGQPVTRESDHS